jgi:hypothetical protein
MIMDIKDLSPLTENTVDQIRVTIHRNKGGVWYATNWTGSQANYQNISGGNVIYGTSNTTTSAITSAPAVSRDIRINTLKEETVTVNKIDAAVYPNPAPAQFNVRVESNNTKDRIHVRVMDATGKVIDAVQNVAPTQTLRLGGLYKPGVYFVEVMQGNDRKVIKVIKQQE